MLTVSATDLARNTREILDRLVADGQPIAVERNQILIAQLSAPPRRITVEQALALFSSGPRLSTKQSQAWLTDSKANFENDVKDPWE